jgi:cobalt-zinc-cadmium resistance protein CzcA
VNAIGGYEKQIVIAPDPAKLTDGRRELFDQLAEVMRNSTDNAGGGVLELGGEAVVVRADTRAKTATKT